MDKCNFLESFTEKYESFKLKEPTIDNLFDELSYYESSIPEFFSKNGEATGIRNMYSGIHEMMENGVDKSIKCVDINKSNAIYVEYMDGMIKFINDIKNLNLNGNESMSSFTEKFENAKNKDMIFIESLYNGKINEIEDVPLSEAVYNIEFLIDFIPGLKTMKSNCCTVQESVKEVTDSSKKQLLDDCTKMLCESVNNFCYHTIKAVLESYDNITLAISGDNEPVTVSSDTPFTLFI